MSTHTHQHARDLLSERDRLRLGRRAQLLAGASVTYNVLEAVVAITAGVVAGSVALVGFGLDSVVEVSSGLIILWQFRHRMPESRERQALRLMALSFFALAGYVTFESVRALVAGHEPEASPVGIGLAAASLVIMPFLSWAQRRTGKALGSNAVVADSTQTLLCTYLSAVLLFGLVLNAGLGWTWADPIAALVVAGVALKEGREAWRGEGCCGPIGTHHHADGQADGCSDTGCGDACCTPPGSQPGGRARTDGRRDAALPDPPHGQAQAMTLAALLLFPVCLTVGFGLRTWLQVRPTGDTGLRGLSGGRRQSGVVGLGLLGAVLTQMAMGAGWRIGVEKGERTELVTSGPFALVRNPIFTAMAVTGIGLALMVPNALPGISRPATFTTEEQVV